MSPTTFLVTLGALVACKVAARIGMARGRFENLPHPSQID
jgi:hypothetical protein